MLQSEGIFDAPPRLNCDVPVINRIILSCFGRTCVEFRDAKEFVDFAGTDMRLLAPLRRRRGVLRLPGGESDAALPAELCFPGNALEPL